MPSGRRSPLIRGTGPSIRGPWSASGIRTGDCADTVTRCPRTDTSARSPGQHGERDLVSGQVHPDPGALQGDAEAHPVPRLGQPRVEGDHAVVVAHPAEPVRQAVPHPAGRGHVHPVGGVAVQVGQVDEQRAVEVAQRQLAVADLGGDDRLHHPGQGGVAGGDRVVVLEVGALLLGAEVVALQEQRQHHVGLLEHLEAVDHQRVVVQQQRPLLRRGVGQVPHLAVQEVRVLRVDPGDRVVRDGHGVGAGAPLLDLGPVEVQPGDHPLVGLGQVAAQLPHHLGGLVAGCSGPSRW